MKTKILFFLSAVCIFSFSSLTAQNFPDLDKSPLDIASYPSDYRNAEKMIQVIYSRPQLKGRPLEQLAPAGKVWRTGANETSQIILYTPMELGGTKLEPGTYSFYTIPGESEWKIILNRKLNTWGAYFYDEASDVMGFSVSKQTVEDSLEAFSITFTETEAGANMHMGWGTTRVVVPFKKV